MVEKTRVIGSSLVPQEYIVWQYGNKGLEDGGRVIANKRQGHANHLGNG